MVSGFKNQLILCIFPQNVLLFWFFLGMYLTTSLKQTKVNFKAYNNLSMHSLSVPSLKWSVVPIPALLRGLMTQQDQPLFNISLLPIIWFVDPNSEVYKGITEHIGFVSSVFLKNKTLFCYKVSRRKCCWDTVY